MKKKIISELDSCIVSEEELSIGKWKKGYDDKWPVQRTYPLE